VWNILHPFFAVFRNILPPNVAINPTKNVSSFKKTAENALKTAILSKKKRFLSDFLALKYC
jgi:hypothetical protein